MHKAYFKNQQSDLARCKHCDRIRICKTVKTFKTLIESTSTSSSSSNFLDKEFNIKHPGQMSGTFVSDKEEFFVFSNYR